MSFTFVSGSIQLKNQQAIVINGLVPRGAYDNATDYAVGDSVDYQGSSYVMHTNASAGTVPTNTTYWQVLASKGDTGSTGANGATGATGQGVPIGGTSGQVLAKSSSTDYDAAWINNTGSGISESLAIAYAVAL